MTSVRGHGEMGRNALFRPWAQTCGIYSIFSTFFDSRSQRFYRAVSPGNVLLIKDTSVFGRISGVDLPLSRGEQESGQTGSAILLYTMPRILLTRFFGILCCFGTENCPDAGTWGLRTLPWELHQQRGW